MCCSKVCLDGNARHAIAHRTAPANKALGEMANRTAFIMASEETAREHRDVDNVAGFFFGGELGRADDGGSPKRQKHSSWKCEFGGERDWCGAAPVDGTGSAVEDAGTHLGFDGSRGANMNVLTVIQRTSALLGRVCGQNGRLRDLREGLEVSRTSVVWMATAPLTCAVQHPQMV